MSLNGLAEIRGRKRNELPQWGGNDNTHLWKLLCFINYTVIFDRKDCKIMRKIEDEWQRQYEKEKQRQLSEALYWEEIQDLIDEEIHTELIKEARRDEELRRRYRYLAEVEGRE